MGTKTKRRPQGNINFPAKSQDVLQHAGHGTRNPRKWKEVLTEGTTILKNRAGKHPRCKDLPWQSTCWVNNTAQSFWETHWQLSKPNRRMRLQGPSVCFWLTPVIWICIQVLILVVLIPQCKFNAWKPMKYECNKRYFCEKQLEYLKTIQKDESLSKQVGKVCIRQL